MKEQSGFIKNQCAGWVAFEINRQARQRGVRHHANTVMGLLDGRLKRWKDEGQPFIYLDHSYFKRGWSNNNFRAIANACHLNTIKDRSDDRMKKFGVVVEPWRKKRGNKIVLIPTYAGHHALWDGMHVWMDAVRHKISKLTDRPIVVKHKQDGPLRAALEDAWCLVCNQSVAGVEAALMGVPVFSTPLCCSYPVSNKLEDIEHPEFPDNRHEWASSLAYACWNSNEIDEVDWINYDYAVRDHMSS